MVDFGQLIHQLVKDLGRVSCNQIEVATVKQDGYPTLFLLHPDKEKGEWGDSLHITYREI